MSDPKRIRMHTGKGFIAALDQSGGSTPKALRLYGIAEDAYHSDEEMFDLVHEMRTRILTCPSFTSEHILAAILFENTMERKVNNEYTADYLWNQKGILPILKVDKGLAPLEKRRSADEGNSTAGGAARACKTAPYLWNEDALCYQGKQYGWYPRYRRAAVRYR